MVGSDSGACSDYALYVHTEDTPEACRDNGGTHHSDYVSEVTGQPVPYCYCLRHAREHAARFHAQLSAPFTYDGLTRLIEQADEVYRAMSEWVFEHSDDDSVAVDYANDAGNSARNLAADLARLRRTLDA